MKRSAVIGAASALLSIAAGCSEDVGDCYPGPDGQGAFITVVSADNGDHVEYAGQAIINRACATGCHQSGVTGAARKGAPAGLDFDLKPVSGDDLEGAMNDAGRTFAVLPRDAINALRERQRRVFSMRNSIWAQVRDGLMPPDGVGAGFRTAVESLFKSSDASPCTRGDALQNVETKASQDLLRNWLACQAPIVESFGGPTSANGTAGVAGYQYLACDDTGGGDGGQMSTVTLGDLMSSTGLLQTTLCSACHPALAKDYPLDLSSFEKASSTLLSTRDACDGKPYVTPGDPDKSFLIDVVSKDDPGCSIERMPQGGSLTTSQINQLRAWITAGAPVGTAPSALIHPPLGGGLDAGTP